MSGSVAAGGCASDGELPDGTERVDAALKHGLRSALLVPVAEVEPVVGEHRRRLDRSAIAGVPAHVTVLYPFLPPAGITPEVVSSVADTVTMTAAFDCTFSRVRWFGDHLVWLQPEPDEPFRALTHAVQDAFGGLAPYGGAHGDPDPHLTVAGAHLAGPAELRQAAAEIEPMLPVPARIDRVWLMVGADVPGSWRTRAEFRLPAGGSEQAG